MNFLVNNLCRLPLFTSCLKGINEKKGPVLISGLTDVSKCLVASALLNSLNKQIIIITYNEIQAKKLVNDLKYFEKNVYFFPKREIVTYDFVAESKDLPYERIEVLNKIQSENANIVVTTIEAVIQSMVPTKTLYKNIINLKIGTEYGMEKLKETLINLGYERVDLVEAKGQFSIRGGIIDIACQENEGVRIEFWGDEIDSIRKFKLSSQRSIENLSEVKIFPAHEFVMEKSLDKVIDDILEKNIHNDETDEIIYNDIEEIKNGNFYSKIDKYFNSFYSESGSILDFLSKDTIIMLDENSKIIKRIENIKEDNKNLITNLKNKNKKVPDVINNLIDYSYNLDKGNAVFLENEDLLSGKIEKEYHFHYREVNFFKSEMEVFLENLKLAVNDKKNVVILGGNEASGRKMSLVLAENDIPHIFNEKADESKLKEGVILVTTGALSCGFECYDLNLLVISSEEIFSGENKKRKLSKNFKQAEKVVYADLKIGDFVVHKYHGIGQFIGVNTITADNVIKDYIKIKYKGDDILYVPTNSLDTVRKYIGEGDSIPRLNSLGGKEWENTKKKVKSNLREVARDLIELYAKRQNVKGYAFSKDTDWQKQFEESFPYQETDDQLRSIEETKKDMESNKPMDRLLCGDVGYGKTEVAIRAAFKAIMDNKQVAYLVPTTVLANQQYEEFKTRMEGFGVNVEVLNRFKTKKQQDEIVKKLKLGEVDCIVGTHRLLSKDVEFNDLGLLIIDEEHRFGVKAKEKIKHLKSNIDVLTMTATPIPRTLHMSIVGVRDMSCLYEPPHNRKPVQTYVLEYDDEIIKEAILRELERGGQVFYLFNNVERIEEKAIHITELVPEAKVSVAHGKMTGKQLEDIMMQFIKQETNVLVCTTILESGIDIPNANTIIVENADRLGLAQLYQIRGRVGRSDRQAYAFVTYRRDKVLTEVADKRLKAIKEFTEFGSGFRIAMRDLEIRGARKFASEKFSMVIWNK